MTDAGEARLVAVAADTVFKDQMAAIYVDLNSVAVESQNAVTGSK